MAATNSPGWYPAPDGNGQQWWNGAGWSESRRNADGSTPGMPGYQAAPPAPAAAGSAPAAPVPLGAPNPYAAQPAAPVVVGGARTKATNPTLVGVILGAVSIFAFAPLGVAAVVLGIMGLRKPGASRGMSWLAIGLGAVGLVFGLVQLVILIAGMASVDFDV